MEVADSLSEFVSRCPVGSDLVRHVVRLSMLDWAAVTIAGKNEPVSKLVRSLADEEGGKKHAFAIGLSMRVPARSAALVNGTTSHALDYDDTHFAYIGHPSVVIFPAVMALADKLESSMEEIQKAALIGLETATRVGVWLGRTHYRTGFHITATAGTFGAAAACSRLLGHCNTKTKMALGLAASRSSGVKQQFGTMGKPYHAGMAAAAGLEVALLADKGFEAAGDALTGIQGFAITHHGESNDHAFEKLGKGWFFEEVSHKFHACCHGTHAMLEALALIRNAHTFSLEEIVSIEVHTHPQYLNVCNIQSPVTGLESKFSFRLIAALGLTGVDTARPDSFTDEVCKVPEIVALRDITNVLTDDALSDTQSRVTLILSGGRKLDATSNLLDLKSPHEREARVRAKASSLLGESRQRNLWQIIAKNSAKKATQSVAEMLLLSE